MSKKIKYDLMLQVPAQSVTAGPPIATSLGPKGVPLGLFAKAVNDQTADYNKGWQVRVRVKIFDDKSYDAKILGYTTRELLFRKANISSGSQTPGNKNIATLKMKDIEEIAAQKFPGAPLDVATRTILGSARSMGIKVD